MTNEEKKAVEKIDYIQDFIIENGQYNADIEDIKCFSTIKNLIEKQAKELEQKEKIIDEMAEHLTTPIHSKKDVIEYFENLAKESGEIDER